MVKKLKPEVAVISSKPETDSIEKKRREARNILQRTLAGSKLESVSLLHSLDELMTVSETKEREANALLAGGPGALVFAIREKFLIAKQPWTAFLEGNSPFADCGLQAVTGIARSTALKYLHLYNEMRALPIYVPETLVTAMQRKFGTANKQIQHGAVVEYLLTPDGESAIKNTDLSTADKAISFLNSVVKAEKEKRADREEKTTQDRLRSALTSIYLSDGIGKDRKEPPVEKSTARMGFFLGLQRMAEDLNHLTGSISAMNAHSMKVSVTFGTLEKDIQSLAGKSEKTA